MAIPQAVTIVAPLPEYLSQKNVEATLGLDADRYLDVLREPGCPLEVIRCGKLRLVARTSFVAYLRERSAAETSRQPTADDGLDDVRERIGLVSRGTR